MVGGSGSRKTNAFVNPINHEPYINKILLYTKDPYESKYQLLMKKRECAGLKCLNNSKAFSECPNDMDDIYKNIGESNRNNKWKILIVFDGRISDMLSNKKHNSIVTELFIWGRKLCISIVFMTQSYFVKRTILLWKFQVKESFNKLHLITHQILTFKTLWIFIKSAMQKRILFLLLILLLHQVIAYVLERIF